jgi:hypothetical protein
MQLAPATSRAPTFPADQVVAPLDGLLPERGPLEIAEMTTRLDEHVPGLQAHEVDLVAMFADVPAQTTHNVQKSIFGKALPYGAVDYDASAQAGRAIATWKAAVAASGIAGVTPTWVEQYGPDHHGGTAPDFDDLREHEAVLNLSMAGTPDSKGYGSNVYYRFDVRSGPKALRDVYQAWRQLHADLQGAPYTVWPH